MSISFSGLASGLDTSSWVKSLTQLRQAKVTTLETQKATLATAQTTLQGIRSFFSSFRASLEKITDSKFNVSSMDIFSKKLAAVSNAAILSATAKSNAAEGSYEVKVNNTATQTQVKSGYRYKTTLVSTTQATTSSYLKNVGVGYGTEPESGIKAGNIEITHNDVTSTISISANETMSSFLDKLHAVGINAEFDNNTGIFSIDVNVGDINDVDNTNILSKLKISDINYGYSCEQLHQEEEEIIYHQATVDTLLSDLGVNAGDVYIKTGLGEYQVTLEANETIGSLVTALVDAGIEASFNDGVFSINNAYIYDDTTTGLIEHFGLTNPVSQTQQSDGLVYQTITSSTTTAALDSLIADINGVTLEGDETIIVQNASGETSTITIGTDTTIGDMVNAFNNGEVGLHATFTNGILSIDNGFIIGGTFDIEGAFGLEYTGEMQTVTGSSLTVTTTTITGATGDTQLKNLSTAVTSGTIKVTDTTDVVHNLVIDENSTIGDFVNSIRALGLGANFNDATGVLTLTGGSYTIEGVPEGSASNILNVFFNQDTLTPSAIDSATAVSEALNVSIITTTNATGTTTLSELGMAEGTYNATFRTGETEVTVTINGSTTLDGLASLLRTGGVDAEFDNALHSLVLTDATFLGVTGGNFDTIMNFSSTITGRNAVSDTITGAGTTTGRNMTSSGAVMHDVETSETITTSVTTTTPIASSSDELTYTTTETVSGTTTGVDIIGAALNYNEVTTTGATQTSGTITYVSGTNTVTVGQTATGTVLSGVTTTAISQTSGVLATEEVTPGEEPITTTVGATSTSETIYTNATTVAAAQSSTITYSTTNVVPGSTVGINGTQSTDPITWVTTEHVGGTTTTIAATQTSTIPPITTTEVIGGTTTGISTTLVSDTLHYYSVSAAATTTYAVGTQGDQVTYEYTGTYGLSQISNTFTVQGTVYGTTTTGNVAYATTQAYAGRLLSSTNNLAAYIGQSISGSATLSNGSIIRLTTDSGADHGVIYCRDISDIVAALQDAGVANVSFNDSTHQMTVNSNSPSDISIVSVNGQLMTTFFNEGINTSYYGGGHNATAIDTLAAAGYDNNYGTEIQLNNNTAIITVSATTTFGELVQALNDNDIQASLINGQIHIEDSKGYIRYMNPNLSTFFGIDTGPDISYTSGTVELNMTESTTLLTLGMNTSNRLGTMDGHYYTFTTSNTVGDVIDTLESLGYECDLTNGVLSFDPANGMSTNNMITSMSAALMNVLGLQDSTFKVSGYTNSTCSSDELVLSYTLATSVTATTSLEDLGYGSNFVVYDNNGNSLAISKTSSLLEVYTALSTFTNGGITITANGVDLNDPMAPSDFNTFTISFTAGSTTAIVNIDGALNGTCLLDPTQFGYGKSYEYIDNSTSTLLTATGSTRLSDFGAPWNAADRVITYNGGSYTCSISATINNVISALSTYAGVSASISNGVLSITGDSTHYIKDLGAGLKAIFGGTIQDVGEGVTYNITGGNYVTTTVSVTGGMTTFAGLGLSDEDIWVVDNLGNTITSSSSNSIENLFANLNANGISYNKGDFAHSNILTIGDPGDTNWITDMSSALANAFGIQAGDGYSYNINYAGGSTQTVTHTAQSTTTLGELGLTSDAHIVTHDGTVTVTSLDTFDSLIEKLQGHLVASFDDASGVFSITQRLNKYIESIDSPELLSILSGITVGEGHTYSVQESYTETVTATGSEILAMQLSELGLNHNAIVEFSNGDRITIGSDTTVAEALNTIKAAEPITVGSVESLVPPGLTITVGDPSDSVWITDIDSDLASILGIGSGDGSSYNVSGNNTVTSDMTLAQLGMVGATGTIVTDLATITVSATDTLEDVMDKIQGTPAPDWTTSVQANAGTIGGISLEEAAAANNGFISAVNTVAPQVTIVNAADLESAISTYTTIGIGSVEALAELAKIVNGTDGYTANNCLNKTFVLTSDLDLTSICAANTNGSGVGGWTAIGTHTNTFRGKFNGNGHVISGLYINRANTNYVGLFGDIDSNGSQISNVGLEDVNVTGKNYTGGIAGHSESIVNCYVTGTVTGNGSYTGLLAGSSGSSTVLNCYTTGTVTGNNCSGGLVGISDDVVNCYSNANVTGTNGAGGLIGMAFAGDLTNCYATGSVTGDDTVGGLVGQGFVITNSYSTGNVNGNTKVGGLVGRVYTSTISNCYTTGSVSGETDVGGIVGIAGLEPTYASEFLILSSIFSTGTISGENNTGGLIGKLVDTNGSEYLTVTIQNTAALSQGFDMIGFEGSNSGTPYESGNMSSWLSTATDIIMSGVSGSLTNGQFSITPEDGHYVQSISPNLAAALHMQAGDGHTYNVNVTPGTDPVTTAVTATSSTTFADLGLSGTATINTANSSPIVLNIDGGATVGDLVSALNSSGIYATLNSDGTLVIGDSGDTNQITGISGPLSSLLHIYSGQGNSYSVDGGILSADATLGDRGMTVDGTITTDTGVYTFTSSSTIQDVLDTLNDDAGLDASFVNGRFSIAPQDGHYVSNMTSNIAAALGFAPGDIGPYGSYYTETGDSITTTVSGTTTLSQLGLRSGNQQIVFGDGTTANGIDGTYTVDDIIDILGDHGVTASVTNGQFALGDSGDTNYVSNMSLSLRVALGIDTGEGYTYDSGTISHDATGSTTLSTLGLAAGNYNIVTNTGTITVTETSTIDSVVSALTSAGFDNVSLNNTTHALNIGTTEGHYIESIDSALASVLKINAPYSTTTADSTNVTTHTAEATTDLATLGMVGASGTIITDNGNVAISSSDTLQTVIDKLGSVNITATLTDGVFTIGDAGDSNFVRNMSQNLQSVFNNLSVGEGFTYNLGSGSTVQTTTTTTTEAVTGACTFGELGISNSIINISNGETVTVNSDTTISDFMTDMTGKGISVYLTNGYFSLEPQDGNYIESVTGDNILGAMNLVGSTYSVSAGTLGTTKLKDLKDSLGNNLGISSGLIKAYKNGISSNIFIDNESTLDELASQLSSYNIQMVYSSGTNGKIYFTGSGNSYLSEVAEGSNLMTQLGISDWAQVENTASQALSYTSGSNEVITGSTKLVDLKDSEGNSIGITTGKYKIVAGGINYEGSISAATTVNDLFSQLSLYGISGSINSEGQITLNTSNDDTYLVNSGGAAGYSNIVEELFPSWTMGNIYTSRSMSESNVSTVNMTSTTRLKDIDQGTYQAGKIVVSRMGEEDSIIELSENATVGDFMSAIAYYGFNSYVENGRLVVRNDGYTTMHEYTDTPSESSNVLSLLGLDTDPWESPGNYTGDAQSATTYSTNLVAATRNTQLSELRSTDGTSLGITTGEFIVHSNGVQHTVNLTSTDITLDQFINTLSNYGINAVLNTDATNSILKIVGSGDTYLTSSEAPGASNVVEKLFGNNAPSSLYDYSKYEETSETVTHTVIATLSTALSDYDNGTIKSEGTLALSVGGNQSQINITSYDTFGSLIEKFERAGVHASLVDGVLKLESGNQLFEIDTENSTSNLLDNLGLLFSNNLGGFAASNDSVTQTTTTIEDRTLSVAKYADYDTQMGLLNISSGTLSVYRNGAKKLITIDNTETFSQFRTRIQDALGDVDIDFMNGKLRFFSTNEGVDVQVGSSNDTSNISSICGFSQDENGYIISARELYKVNASSLITAEGLFRYGDVTEGTFIIGDATFNITSETTIQNIVAQINSSDKANASAYWDSVDGKLVISSRSTGASMVNIEAGTSNFTDILGLTTSEWDGAGNPTITRIRLDSQELGQNARFTINGTSFQSASNVITSDVSRIQGLTLNLKSSSMGDTVTVTVSKDSEAVSEAVGEFVDAYNELVENVDAELKSSGALKDQSTLKFIRQQIRNLLVNTFAGATTFRNLAALGISTSAGNSIGIDTSNAGVEYLYFDSEKFLEGYNKDAEAVKNMLVGSDETPGILIQVENIVENALATGTGYFSIADKSYSDKITSINEKIKKANLAIEAYRARLESKFQSMDLLISQMQNQYNSFLSGNKTT